MSSIDKRELIDRYIEAYNTFDIDSMRAFIHPESGSKTCQTVKLQSRLPVCLHLNLLQGSQRLCLEQEHRQSNL
jgi:hypothetical protein